MKPLDLLDRDIPSIWRVHCKNDADEWDIVGLFNFENRPEERTIELASLGFAADVQAAAFEFWEQKFLGIHHEKLTVLLPPQTSRIVAIHTLRAQPQIIGTDLHLLQGYHELKRVTWDANSRFLSGECERMPGISGQLFLHVPEGFTPHFDFPLIEKSARLTHLNGRLWAYEINFQQASEKWNIPFDAAQK